MSIKKSISSILLIFAVLLAMASTSAASPYTYATDVRWDSGNGVNWSDTQRSLQSNALGSPNSNFLSLGRGGLAVFDFGIEFDVTAIVFETTWNNRSNYLETANVYVADSAYNFSILNASNGGAGINIADFTIVGSITNEIESTILSLTGGPFRYVLIEDTTTDTRKDGFDVNAVGVVPVAVPEPGTLLLLGSGLAGLALYRRRMNKV